MRTLFLLSVLSFAILTVLSAQQPSSAANGQVRGKVFDAESGEPLIGATVRLDGTALGIATDFDGAFVLRNVPVGVYTVKVSYVGYATLTVTGSEVKKDQELVLNLSLRSESLQAEEVIVTAKAIRSSDATVLALRKQSSTIGDGISAEMIKRTPDATSADALRRVTGLSVVENKYVFVRGTSERYSQTMLNGSTLSSTEPEKKSFAFDMFPSNLLDNMVVAKSFSSDMPGDVAGGVVQMNTLDFPTSLSMRLGVGQGLLAGTTGRSFLTYEGGGRDWLGMDDGTRALPAGLPDQILSGSSYTQEQLQAMGRLFANNWTTQTRRAPTNSNFFLSIGDGTTILGEDFGFVGALTYRNSFANNEIVANDYEVAGPKFELSGQKSTASVLWGGMLNLSYRLGRNHKVTVRNLFNRSADDQAAVLTGINHVSYAQPYDVRITTLRYVSRSMYNGQVGAEHAFPELSGLHLDWRISHSVSDRQEPDYRRTGYRRETGTDDPYQLIVNVQADPQNGGRFYSSLWDRATNGGFDVSFDAFGAKVKTGLLYETRRRTFNSRLLGFIYVPGRTDFNLFTYAIDSVFAPQNIGPNGFRIAEYVAGSNNYSAEHYIRAGYGMVEAPFVVAGQRFKASAGIRVESSTQLLHSLDFSGRQPVEADLSTVDVLPSMNLTYLISENLNLRASAGRTVNRPELRELAPFSYYDFEAGTSTYGNPGLQRAQVLNYDLRAEFFPSPGEVFAISYFYKALSGAIEKVVVPGSALGADRTFDNANGVNRGFELELRKNLGFMWAGLAPMSVYVNYARITSRVDIVATSVGLGRTGRPLQGQSPYIINGGVSYDLPDAGFSASVTYNRIGARIVEVATLYDEDVVEQPRNIIDVTITKDLFSFLEAKLSIKDLTGEDQVFTQGSKTARRSSRDVSTSLGLSFKL